MSNYDEKQMTSTYRRLNDIKACKTVQIDNECGIIFKFPWGDGTSQIRPKDFEIGEWIDLRLYTVCGQNRISLKSAQFIGRTPEPFIPKK